MLDINYIKENPDLYVANGGFKYEPSVLQKNYASISDKEKKNAVEAAKGVVESNKRQEFLSDFGVNKPGKISNNSFARSGVFNNEEVNDNNIKYVVGTSIKRQNASFRDKWSNLGEFDKKFVHLYQ